MKRRIVVANEKWQVNPKLIKRRTVVANKKLQFCPIAMNIKINIKYIVGKVGPNGIIIKN
jgi:hypothetical protein